MQIPLRFSCLSVVAFALNFGPLVHAQVAPMTVDVQMIALPQREAIALLPKLRSEKRADEAAARLNELVKTGVARLVSWQQTTSDPSWPGEMATAAGPDKAPNEKRVHAAGLCFWETGSELEPVAVPPPLDRWQFGAKLHVDGWEKPDKSAGVLLDVERRVVTGIKEWPGGIREAGLAPIFPKFKSHNLHAWTSLRPTMTGARLFAVHRSPDRAGELELWLATVHPAMAVAGVVSDAPAGEARIRLELKLIALSHEHFRVLHGAFAEPQQREAASADLLKLVSQRQARVVETKAVTVEPGRTGKIVSGKTVRCPHEFEPLPVSASIATKAGRRHSIGVRAYQDYPLGLNAVLAAIIQQDRQTLRVFVQGEHARQLRMRDVVMARATNGAHAAVSVPEIWSMSFATDTLVGNERHMLIGIHDAPERPGWVEIWLLKASIVSAARN